MIKAICAIQHVDSFFCWAKKNNTIIIYTIYLYEMYVDMYIEKAQLKHPIRCIYICMAVCDMKTVHCST